MRAGRSLVLGLASGFVVSGWAVLAFGQNAEQMTRPPDGGTREVLESIYVPPMANGAFSLTLETEWTRAMANGGTYTLVNKRPIKRDTSGRIYQERWLLMPKGGKAESQMTAIQVADPVKHILYVCHPQDKTCDLVNFQGVTTVPVVGVGSSGPLPNGNGFRTHVDLGQNSVAGMETTGMRDVTTVNPGVFGNDQPMVTTREFWYSAQLGINLSSIVDSPQAGKQTFTVTELSTSEPEPSFFQAPEGYKVIDRRRPAARDAAIAGER